MIIFRNIVLILCLVLGNGFLTNNQFKCISKILEYNAIYRSDIPDKQFNNIDTLYLEKYNTTFSDIVYETKKILFHHSLPFVHNKYKAFTKSSVASQRLSYGNKHLLLRYGYMGLWKAIKKYDGTSNFYKYSDVYVTSEFKRGLSDIQTNSILPHRLRVNKEFLKLHNMSEYYVTSFSYIDANYDKSLESNFYNHCQLESPETIYEILQVLTQKERSYFTYRYNTYTCKVQRTNKEVAKLMCVSEETARKEIMRVTEIVLKTLQNF